MGVVFDGKSLLHSNEYKRVIIKEIPFGNYKVRAVGDGLKYKSISVSKNLYAELKKGEDYDQIMAIINNYLSYSRVDYIHNDEYLPNQNDYPFFVTRGTRELDLQLFSKKFSHVPKMIADKYMQDRLRFCYDNSDVSSYEIGYGGNSSSYKRTDANFGSYIRFEFSGKRDELNDFDKCFLRDFLYEKLYSVGKEAKIGDSRVYFPAFDNEIYLGTYLKCGDFVVKLYDNYGDLAKEVRSVVNSYNEKRTIAKKKQLKLEGF